MENIEIGLVPEPGDPYRRFRRPDDHFVPGGYIHKALAIDRHAGQAFRDADPQYAGERFVQQRIGLHHLCFRARERADVDACYEFIKQLDAKIIHPPEEGQWAPGYYSVLFEDPDGIRLEVNHVPGKGLLTP